MLLNVQIGRLNLPLKAPRGAAAYYVSLDTKSQTAIVVFAMQQANETGLAALTRVRADKGTYAWQPVAARPETQTPVDGVNGGFVGYDFAYVDHQWQAASTSLMSFLQGTGLFNQMPAVPPKELRTDEKGQKIK